ncbi:rsbT co-antagonist protein RsbR [Fictibacillus solisalsi]|uniref:RsbT co-antagonist protein RsbR n=1 Tax=Fictibacillus solisalsi TaxID=459525 RepID=A0A1H0CBE8_9BACL|nr:STAS domain-containing protein [Fictibacillus solisalsi]SDN55210.1 rsbT co-antagonist protein RsbR [Fictibacillus solisalsi]
MPVTDYVLPVPYFKINTEFHILNFSKQAEALFMITENITSIVDEEGVAKLKNFLQTSSGTQPMEISMKTKNYALELFDLYISWDHYLNGHLICIKKNEQNKNLENMVYRLQSRLSSTDFELFEKKEELEQAIDEIDRLSGPFISLSDEVALIPMFGDITSRKINSIRENTLKNAYREDLDTILFDFTGVGSITLEGLEQMESLFRALSYMGGIESVIVGVKPEHARQMHELNSEVEFSFLSTLQEAMKKYL